MELETDKAVIEVPSSVSGVVKEIKVKQGEKIKVGQIIFTLEGGADRRQRREAEACARRTCLRTAWRAVGISGSDAGRRQDRRTSAASRSAADRRANRFSMPAQLGKVAGTEHREPVPAAPHVRRLAREIGVDIHRCKGTGPGGRISEDDVKAARQSTCWRRRCCSAGSACTFAQPALPDFTKWGKIERVSMRGVRRKTAEHLWQAWNTIPHVTQQDKADITELEQLRARFAPEPKKPAAR